METKKLRRNLKRVVRKKASWAIPEQPSGDVPSLQPVNDEQIAPSIEQLYDNAAAWLSNEQTALLQPRDVYTSRGLGIEARQEPAVSNQQASQMASLDNLEFYISELKRANQERIDALEQRIKDLFKRNKSLAVATNTKLRKEIEELKDKSGNKQ
ncbi:hypothetical protein ABW21_db0204930 [Orbilia brochopaga]|nr:hypothetical protein ABW21_db0204930 [Drechslerella brochopaga]